ncbi:hypothetical protein [Evtepia gabavorous]|uniref:hypothetical protein n=1 Tax=Evtepia gabavorous TaxID=2211183 RepID=UPI003A8E47F5
MKRKLLSVFLSLCMMLTLVPGALAAEPEPTPSEEGGNHHPGCVENRSDSGGQC